MRRVFVAVLVLFSFIATPAIALQYSVSNGSEERLIEPFLFDGSSAEFYNYDTLYGMSAAPVQPGLTNSDAITLFLLESSTSGDDALSLGMIFDTPKDGSGGAVTLSLTGLPGALSVAVIDDYGDYSPETGRVAFSWINCCTDGFLADGISKEAFTARLDFFSRSGLANGFLVATPDGTGGTRLHELGLGDSFTIRAFEEGAAAVSLPATALLLLGALSGLMIAAWKRD